MPAFGYLPVHTKSPARPPLLAGLFAMRERVMDTLTAVIVIAVIAAVSSGALFVIMRWGEAAGEVAAAETDEKLKK
jgi:hypothetical protein